MQARHLGAIEVQHGGPFALAIVAPDDAATQQVSDRARRQITMEIEKHQQNRLSSVYFISCLE